MFRKTHHLAALVLALVLAAQGVTAATPEIKVHDNLSGADPGAYVPGEVVFRYHNDSERFRVMEVPDVEAAVEALSKNPNIEYVEPNFIASALATPNDPLYQPYQWHFDNPTYGGVHAEAAWDVTAGNAETVVAIVDTGIAYEDYSTGGRGRWAERYYQAPDLAGTCFVPGYDFINNDDHANDDNAHGTHVAGTVAQTTNNGEGVAGLAHDTCVMPVKVLDANGNGSYTTVANGIYYAADNGADVINLSLGGSSGSSMLRDAVAYAHAKGVTILAAAGNNNGAVGYPAAYDDHVIAVGATRFDEARAPYSSYGSSLDIVAPGGDTSVDQNGDGQVDGVVQQTFNPSTKNTRDFGYYLFQGTSMATPHAAAAAAMVLAGGNATTPDEVREALQSTADDLGSSGWDQYFGHGIINVPAALAWTSGPVDESPVVSVTAPTEGATVSGEVLISADATDDDAVTEVQFEIDGTIVATTTTAPYELTWDSTSVSDGARTISVTAFDTAGQEASDSVNVTVDNANDDPVADAGPDQSAFVGDTLTFDGSGSSDDRGIASYEWDFGDGASASGATTSHSYGAIGTYTVTLTVTDTDGVSDTDTATVTIEEEPAAPTEVIVDSITYITEGGRENDKHINITTQVLDDFGNPVGNATVALTLERNGSSYASYSGTTDSNGQVLFSEKNTPSGTYTSTIDSVSVDGLTWDGVTPENSLTK